MEGLIFGGASAEYGGKFAFQNLLGRKFTVFLCFILYLRAISKYKPPGGGLYLEGRFNEEFFALRVWGGGLYLEGLIFGILPYQF